MAHARDALPQARGPEQKIDVTRDPKPLHVAVIGPASALRHNPVDILCRILDITGFTVDAVLGIDLESGSCAFLNNFINPSRAIALRRLIKFWQIDGNRNAGILQSEVTGLIFLMIGVG